MKKYNRIMLGKAGVYADQYNRIGSRQPSEEGFVCLPQYRILPLPDRLQAYKVIILSRDICDIEICEERENDTRLHLFVGGE